MRNPLEQLREKEGRALEEFARKLGVSPVTLRVMERGLLRNSRVLWGALERAGYDSRALNRRHQMWLRSRGLQSDGNPDATATA